MPVPLLVHLSPLRAGHKGTAPATAGISPNPLVPAPNLSIVYQMDAVLIQASFVPVKAPPEGREAKLEDKTFKKLWTWDRKGERLK